MEHWSSVPSSRFSQLIHLLLNYQDLTFYHTIQNCDDNKGNFGHQKIVLTCGLLSNHLVFNCGMHFSTFILLGYIWLTNKIK